jgi:aldose 1-epimerase
MYKIIHHPALNILEVTDSNKKLNAKIHLNSGASLQELVLNQQPIIQDLSPLPYETTYASSILFPFANRIKDGIYSFQGEDYQFDINHKDENNALHGLVFNKVFKVLKQETSNDSAIIVLGYNKTNKSKGFPYTFDIQLTYVFTATNIVLQVIIKNTSSQTFPFTIGWHPYFISDDLYNSSLHFDSNQKLLIGDRNITTGIEKITPVESFKIKGQQLDDCWILDSGKILFKTPKYDLTFEASAENNFLQAYTPPKKNAIAIEPTTGVSDSFNNKIGLQELQANESYDIKWSVKITNN